MLPHAKESWHFSLKLSAPQSVSAIGNWQEFCEAQMTESLMKNCKAPTSNLQCLLIKEFYFPFFTATCNFFLYINLNKTNI